MIDNKTIEQARNADIIAFLEKYHRFTEHKHKSVTRARTRKGGGAKNRAFRFYRVLAVQR